MTDQPVPKVSKKAFDGAMTELEQLGAEIETRTKRMKDLRNRMADVFHSGEDGTQTTEIHGWKVTTVRKMGITLPKEAAEQLASDDEDLYDKVCPEKISRALNASAAKKHLDELEDYVITKQGLPTINFKRISE
jgi:hypothetical protein